MNAPCNKCGKPTNSHVLTPRRRYCHVCWLAMTEEERKVIETNAKKATINTVIDNVLNPMLDFEIVEGDKK